jgi:hypothetical protein
MPMRRFLVWATLGISLAALVGCVQPNTSASTGGSVVPSGAASSAGAVPGLIPGAPTQRGPKDTLGGGPVG